MEQLKKHLKEKNKVVLDDTSKEILYKHILHKILKTKYNKLNYNWRFQYIWSLFFLGLFFVILILSVYIKPEYFNISNMYLWTTAQAEYIGTIVSWNGSYQIIDSKNKDLWLSSYISQGWSLVVEKWSEVSVKTSNNAFANVTGPAKVMFKKEWNQIIVDIIYSNSVKIQKNSSTSLLASNNDVLVVKSESKTIISKTDNINISLDSWTWSHQMLTSLVGDIVVSNGDGLWDPIYLKEQDSIILDSELKLFAKNVDDKDSGKLLRIEKGWVDMISNKKDIIVENENNWIITNIDSSGSSDSLWNDINTMSKFVYNWWNISTWDNWTNSWVNEVLMMNITDEKDLIEMVWDINKEKTESNPSINIQQNEDDLSKILHVKPILDGKILELVDKLYEWYYYTYNKDISKVSDKILELCSELKIRCDDTNLISSLNKINGKIINTYVITPDIKLID